MRSLVLIGLILLTAASTPAAEPMVSTTAEQALLAFVPHSAESVYCVQQPGKLRHQTDLSEASALQMAVQSTTALAGRHRTALNLEGREVRCAVSVAREFTLPKPRRAGEKMVIDGTFGSQRCELLLISESLPADWLASIAKRHATTTTTLAGREVARLTLDDERLVVSCLTDQIVCIANEEALLTKVHSLANRKQSDRMLQSAASFQSARACLSRSPPFWGIRWCDHAAAEDSTSLRNPRNLLGVHDGKATFLAMELPTADASSLRFHYASGDDDAAGRVIESVGGSLKEIAAQSSRRIDQSLLLHSRYYDLATSEDEEPESVLFNYFGVLFGQGMML